MPTVADLLKSPQTPPSAGPQAPVAATDEPNPFDQFDGAANPFDHFQPPPARTVADLLKMGVRNLMTGAGGLVDLVDAPLNSTINTFVPGANLSEHLGRDAANAVGDALGLPEPVTDQEKLAAAINEGGVQGVVTAAASPALAGVKGGVGIVARNLAAHPVVDTVASAGAAGSAELARQHGAGPIGQLAAGLAGGLTTAGGAQRSARTVADILGGITERWGPKAAKIATEVPREAVIDPKGNLTEEGRDVAAQAGLHPDELRGVYDDAEAAVKQAEAAPVAEPAAAAPEAAAKPPEAAPVAEPTGPLETPPSAAPEAPVEAAPVEEPLPASAQERLAQAQSEGVDLTRGQATQDFDAQAKEQGLAAQAGPEGQAVRQFFVNQQQQIADAVDRFKAAFGNPDATAAERGQAVKDALSEMRDRGKAGVTALYKQARDLAQGLGEQGSNLLRLDTQPLLDAMRGIWSDEAVPEQVRRSLQQQAAKYGLIGDTPRTIEGETTVQVRDSSGEASRPIKFIGQPEPLTILNAEDLRQKINQLYEADTSKQSQALKPLIDDAVQSAVERAANEGTGDVGAAFKAARAAHVQQVQTFKAKDVVQKLIDWKRGTATPVTLPENAIKTIFVGGKEALTELRKVKAVLLSNPTPKSKAAWQAIQAHAVADIFDKAMVINANPGGGVMGQISGAKLNTAIAKFGVDKLRVLLPEPEFRQLMKLRRIVGDATIPIQRTTNHSGSGWAVIRFLAGQGMKLASVARFVPGVGPIADAATGLVRIGREAAEAKKVAAGVTDFTPEAAAKADQPKTEPADYARRFIKVAGSDEIIAPLIASAANEQRK